MEIAQLSERINARFESAFGRTPLAERVQDILAQATTLGRFADMGHLRDEAGDLLASVLQLCSECGWDPATLVDQTLAKIDSRMDIYRRLGRKLKVAILGGAFDPIHLGHVEVAQAVLEHGGVDEVWLMPCFEHLAGKSMASAQHRLEMCRLATRGIRGVGVFDYEIRHEFRGETYHLVKKLLAEEIARVRCDFRLIIGQDNAESFSSWTNAEGLERLIPFITVPREGCPAPKLSAWYLRHPHRYLEGTSQRFPTSSTRIRELIRTRNAEVETLVSGDVLGYIRSHGLYAPAADPLKPAAANRRIAMFATTFDPPLRFHRDAVEALLADGFDEVVVRPTATWIDLREPEHASPANRAALVDIAFQGLSRVRVDLSDLDEGKFVSPAEAERRIAKSGEIWHVAAADLIVGGRDGNAPIQVRWDEGKALWQRARFLVVHSPRSIPDRADLPPNSRLLAVDGHVKSSEIRNRLSEGESADECLTSEVVSYIDRLQLFRPTVRSRVGRFTLVDPRPMIVPAPNNPKAAELAARYRERYPDDRSPNFVLVLGGDGSMLATIREHWRRRIPFLGLNCGHLGFLLNQSLPIDLEGLELVTYPMPMLRVDSEAPDGRRNHGMLAYSDAWVERASGQSAWLRLDIDGQPRIPKLVGDGVLVATPSGSSAYARAMGAGPVPLGSPVLTLAGSNVFRPRFWKPMTLADDVAITLADLGETGKRPVRGFVDGHPIGEVRTMSIRKSAVAQVELAFTREFDPSSKLLRSLFPPADDGE
jgi:NAD+ kinase